MIFKDYEDSHTIDEPEVKLLLQSFIEARARTSQDPTFFHSLLWHLHNKEYLTALQVLALLTRPHPLCAHCGCDPRPVKPKLAYSNGKRLETAAGHPQKKTGRGGPK